MKPFNLAEYLKNPSRKVVTRSGDVVKIHCIYCDDSDYPIIARVEGTSFSTTPFTKDGKFIKCRDTKYDLFFASEKHEGWINIYKNPSGYVFPSHIFKTKEEAEETGKECSGYIKTSKIEWEG